MNRCITLRWKGAVLDALDMGDGQVRLILVGEADVAVFDRRTMKWPAAPVWLKRLAPREVLVEFEKHVLLRVFDT